MKRALHFPTRLNSRDIQKCNILFLRTLLLSVRLSSQSSISRAHGDRRSQIEKHVVFSVRSNLPSKCSAVLSEPKFGPPPSPQIKNDLVHHFHINHNTPYLPPTAPPQKYNFQVLLGGLQIPGQIGNNAYAKLLGGNQGVLWECESSESAPVIRL